MARHLPPLGSLRAFEAAARSMSFSQAAEELNVTQGAISRQIKILEEYLGVKLFRRLPRYIELTEQGRFYFGSVQEAFDELYRSTESIVGNHRTVTLNANILPTFAVKWLIPRLPQFAAAHPSIEVRMITSIKPVDFKLEDNDIAVRVGPASPGLGRKPSPIDLVMTNDWLNVRAIPLIPDELVVVCSPTLRDGNPPLHHPSDLRNHTLLHTATREKAWPFWFRTMGLEEVTGQRAGAYGHFFMTLQAAIEGKGVAIVPRVLAAPELDAGVLVTPFASATVVAGTYYLLCRESHWDSPKIKTFREWIMSEISDGSTAAEADSSGAPRK